MYGTYGLSLYTKERALLLAGNSRDIMTESDSNSIDCIHVISNVLFFPFMNDGFAFCVLRF